MTHVRTHADLAKQYRQLSKDRWFRKGFFEVENALIREPLERLFPVLNECLWYVVKTQPDCYLVKVQDHWSLPRVPEGHAIPKVHPEKNRFLQQ